MDVNVETKYLCNGFLYSGKDASRDPLVRLPTHILMKHEAHAIAFQN